MRKIGVAAVSAVAAMTALPAVVMPAPALAVTSGPCARYVALLVPGTTETTANANPATPAGMLGKVGEALAGRYGDSLEAVYVPYPGEAFFNGTSYANSKSKGDIAAADLMKRCSTSQFVVAGYSQGAQIANDLAVNIGAGRGPVPASQVKAVVLLANPKQGTAGSKLYGPELDGKGIAGPAPEGFGALSGRVFDICHPDDAYCNTSPAATPFLASLGRVIANPPGSVEPSTKAADVTAATPAIGDKGASGDSSTLVKELSSPGDWRNADLSAVVGSASRLAESVSALTSSGTVGSTPSAANVARVAQQARLVADTLEPVSQASGWLKTNEGARETLTSAPDGSPEAVTASVMSTLDQVDVPSMLTAATSVIDTSESLLSSRASGAGTVSLADLAGPADALVAGVAPLAANGPEELRTATQVLSVVKPSTMINQLLNVVAGVTTVDYPAVANGLQQLPVKIVSGDIKGAHQIAGDLNNQLSPLVKMAAGVDYKTLSRLVAMIPDPSGTAVTASLILGLLGNVDIIRLARNVGEIQEIAWAVAETGNPAELARLMPVGLDLAQVALGVLSPGQKMSADQLHAPADPMGALMAVQAKDSDLVGLGTSAMALADSDGAAAVAQLVSEGFTAANFYASNSHVSYPNWSPDGKSNALDAMVQIFSRSIGG